MSEPVNRNASLKSRCGSQIVQALLIDEETKPKVQEFVQDLERNRTIEQLEDLLLSWNELRNGLQSQNNTVDVQNSSRRNLENALESINEHLNYRNSKQRLSIPLADQLGLPGTVTNEETDSKHHETETRPIAGPKPHPKRNKSKSELMKHPSFQRFFNTVSTHNIHGEHPKKVQGMHQSLPHNQSEAMIQLSYRNFSPIRLFFVGNIEIPMDNSSKYPYLFLHPEAKARRPWNLLMTFSIAYFAIVLPLRIAFEEALKSQEGLLAFETFLDCCYLLEIGLNFITVDVHNTLHGRVIYDFRLRYSALFLSNATS